MLTIEKKSMDRFVNVFTLIEKLSIRVDNYYNDFETIRNEVSKIKESARRWKHKALEYEIELEKLYQENKEYEKALTMLEDEINKQKEIK
jgi:uncharacterized protein YukE